MGMRIVKHDEFLTKYFDKISIALYTLQSRSGQRVYSQPAFSTHFIRCKFEMSFTYSSCVLSTNARPRTPKSWTPNCNPRVVRDKLIM